MANAAPNRSFGIRHSEFVISIFSSLRLASRPALRHFARMLCSLHIRNLALVEQLEWNLSPGFVAITGETGSGKSIIVGALKLVLGERADRALIRTGAESCTVEAVFEVRDPA